MKRRKRRSWPLGYLLDGCYFAVRLLGAPESAARIYWDCSYGSQAAECFVQECYERQWPCRILPNSSTEVVVMDFEGNEQKEVVKITVVTTTKFDAA